MQRERDKRPEISLDDYSQLLEELKENSHQVSNLEKEKENLRQKLDNIPTN